MNRKNEYIVKDEKIIDEFIGKYPFAMLCGSDLNSVPVATQIPIFLVKKEGKRFLIGHVMKNSDHFEAFLQNPNALVLFNGPHCYVSSTWYSKPSASTWNYMSVQVSGKLNFVSEKKLEDILQMTSIHFEVEKEKSSAAYYNLPSEFNMAMIKHIAGFEMEINEIKAIFKLSQNKDEKSYNQVIEMLNKGDFNSKEIAKEMDDRRTKLFKN